MEEKKIKAKSSVIVYRSISKNPNKDTYSVELPSGETIEVSGFNIATKNITLIPEKKFK